MFIAAPLVAVVLTIIGGCLAVTIGMATVVVVVVVVVVAITMPPGVVMGDTDITAVVAAATGTIMPDMVVVTTTALVVVAVGIVVTTKEGVISRQGTIPEHCQCRSSRAITSLDHFNGRRRNHLLLPIL